MGGGPSPGLGGPCPGLEGGIRGFPTVPVPLEAMAVPRVPRPLHVAPALRAARARPPFYALGRSVPTAPVARGGIGEEVVRSWREMGAGSERWARKWAGRGRARGAPWRRGGRMGAL